MQSLAATTLGELGAFFGGLAALISILWAIGMVAFKRWFADLSITVNATVLRAIKRGMEAKIVGLDPDEYYTHDIHFSNGISLNVPMVPNVEVVIAENLSLCVIAHDCECTTLALKSVRDSYLPPHTHQHCGELVEVRSGTITHIETGRVYRKDEIWFVGAGEIHSAVFSAGCFAIISCRPALLTAKERPVNLEQMENAFLKNHSVS